MFDRPSRGDVRRRIIVRFAAVVAVFAAATGIHSAANAQQATMAIFAPSTAEVTVTRAGVDTLVDTSGNISMVMDRLDAVNPPFGYFYMPIFHSGGASGRLSGTSRNSDGLPFYGGLIPPRALGTGDTVGILDNLTGGEVVLTGFVYGNAPGLSLAVSVSEGTVDDLAATGEFFLDGNGMTTTTPSMDNLGFVGVVCDAAADLFADTDRLICELICPSGEIENPDATMCMIPLTDAACEAMISGTEPNDDRNACIFTANSCSGIGGVINSGNDGCDFTAASCMELTPPGATENTGGTACTYTAESCGAAIDGATNNAASDGCTFTDASCSAAEDGAGANDDNTACTFSNNSCGMFRAGSVPGGGSCVCPAGEEVIGGEMYCLNFDAPVSSLYTMDNCVSDDVGVWTVSYELDSSATPAVVVAELCDVPYEKIAAPDPVSSGGLAPLQVNVGDTGDSCAMRLHGTAAATTALCNDQTLFSENGFPIKPTGFDASTERLTVDTDGAVSFNGENVPQFAPSPPPPPDPGDDTAAAPASKKSGQHALGVGAGLGVLVYLYAWHYYDGDIGGLFNFSPDYGYSVTEGGYSYRYGGRLDFRNEDLHLYWKAGQANSNGDFGDFRYESGGEYTADLWTASFSEVVRSEESDYDFSLSADYRGGIWRVSPTYRLRHSRFAEAESETANSLNLEGVLRYNRWTISPSAGFNWESADEFGDNARFGLSAVRRF